MEIQMNNKQAKKPTNGQLERRIKSAIIHVDKTKDTKVVYFDDKGLRLTVSEDYAIIATGAHQHVFNAITAGGVSRPYIYTKRFVEIALDNDCTVKDENGNTVRSYAKLFSILKQKEDNKEYNLCWYIDLWLNNIFAPLYSIDETEISSFLIYEQFLHNIARTQIILGERKEDMTNLQFVDELISNEKKFLEGLKESVIIHKKTDEEQVNEEIDALQEISIQENQTQGTQDGEQL